MRLQTPGIFQVFYNRSPSRFFTTIKLLRNLALFRPTFFGLLDWGGDQPPPHPYQKEL